MNTEYKARTYTVEQLIHYLEDLIESGDISKDTKISAYNPYESLCESIRTVPNDATNELQIIGEDVF